MHLSQFLTNCLQTFTKWINFSRRSQQGVTTLCFEQNYTFYSNPSYASQSILNGLSPNLHKVGLIFRDDRNKGSQPYVSSKTAHFHQYLCQFLMDCLETFTKWVNSSRRSQQEVTTLCFEQNFTFSSISLSILNGLPSNLHKVGLIFRDHINKGSQPYVSRKTTHFIQTHHMHLSQFFTNCLQTFTK